MHFERKASAKWHFAIDKNQQKPRKSATPDEGIASNYVGLWTVCVDGRNLHLLSHSRISVTPVLFHFCPQRSTSRVKVVKYNVAHLLNTGISPCEKRVSDSFQSGCFVFARRRHASLSFKCRRNACWLLTLCSFLFTINVHNTLAVCNICHIVFLL